MMMIGIDPHKGSHTAVVVDEIRVRASTDRSCGNGRRHTTNAAGRWSRPGDGLSGVPTAGGSWGAGDRRAGDDGLAGAGVGASERPILDAVLVHSL